MIDVIPFLLLFLSKMEKKLKKINPLPWKHFEFFQGKQQQANFLYLFDSSFILIFVLFIFHFFWNFIYYITTIIIIIFDTNL